MERTVARIRFVLALALGISLFATLICSAGIFVVPIQQIETRAELQLSQRSGKPISDEDIERIVSRSGGIESRAFGTAALLAGVISLMNLAAYLIARSPRSERFPEK